MEIGYMTKAERNIYCAKVASRNLCSGARRNINRRVLDRNPPDETRMIPRWCEKSWKKRREKARRRPRSEIKLLETFMAMNTRMCVYVHVCAYVSLCACIK